MAPRTQPKPMNVAIVEDDPGQREFLLAELAKGGLRVVAVATTAKEAMGLIPKAGPDVVLVDVRLDASEAWGGIDLVSKLREVDPNLRFLMLTVLDEPGPIVAALSAGAHGYLVKADISKRLIDAIHEVHDGCGMLSPRVAEKIVSLFHSVGPVDTQALERLSDRERQVLDCLASGLDYAQTAAALGLSLHTVRTYVERTYNKLNATSLGAATRKLPRSSLMRIFLTVFRRGKQR